ncbi:neurofilament heavy polypeptide-like isoform X2 [Branchiostoma lanceolatum]|uniref:neurofilament heavy polypeptide-like isoform X2 n=1 Tax=Branchiostoma lanceolatum TaxID=7740 RepID=UPI003453DCA7
MCLQVTTAVPPPKKTEVPAPASVKTVDETKKDGSFHDLQMDLAPPKQEPSTSKAKQPQSAASQKLTTETPANSNQKNVANPTPEVTQAQQKDANAKAAPTGSAKAKSPKPKLQSPLQENGSVSKKKPSFSEKKYQTSDEPVKTAEVKPLERKLERKDTAQVLKDKDLNMDTEFLDLDDRKGSGKTLVKDRPAKKKGDWMASKKTQGTSKRHGKKKPTSRKDAHIQELSGSEKACYTCAGYCMCCACCYRLFKDDDDDEVFRRRKCITVFLAIALAIVLVGLIIGLCIGLGGLGGPAPTSPPRFILVPQNLNPIVVGNQNQPVSAGTPAGTGTGTAAGTANDSSTATDGATPGGTTG